MILDTYEKQLLVSQENAMVHQARIISAALEDTILEQEAKLLVEKLELSLESRIRVIDKSGNLIADTATYGLDKEIKQIEITEHISDIRYSDNEWESSRSQKYVRDNTLYQFTVGPINFLKRILGKPVIPLAESDFYTNGNYLNGIEVKSALEGHYGATTRYSAKQRSIQLYSALPVEYFGEISGAILVSQSTFKLLTNLYSVRLDLIRVFFWSVLASIVLSIILSLTITRPIHKLRNRAEVVLDSRGSFINTIVSLKRKDEIGDLSKSLATLSDRLKDKIDFIDNFTADMLHEIKNPLTAIKTSSEIVGDDISNELKPMFNRIMDETVRIEQLLSGLKEITSIDNEIQNDETKKVNIAALISNRCEYYSKLIGPRKKLLTDICDNNVKIDINADRFLQVIDNLIDNANSFIPDDGTITVCCKKDGKFIVITVTDNGQGIPERDIKKIFDRFYSSRKYKGNHSGLGLSISKTICEAYRGTINAENIATGGTKFKIVFPLTII